MFKVKKKPLVDRAEYSACLIKGPKGAKENSYKISNLAEIRKFLGIAPSQYNIYRNSKGCYAFIYRDPEDFKTDFYPLKVGHWIVRNERSGRTSVMAGHMFSCCFENV